MKVKYVPYSQLANAWMLPGGFAKWTRSCVLWQLVKFASFNLKIIKVVAKGH